MPFLQQLKIICDKYDAYYGRYPESEYEGAGIYEYAENEIAQTSHNSDYTAAQRVIEEYLKTEQDLNFHKFGDFVSLRLNQPNG